MKAVIAKFRARLVGIFVLAASTATVFFGQSPYCAAQSTSSAPADEQQIRQQADDFSKAFSAADAAAIANMWADDCSFTDVDGQRYLGRESLRKLYEQFFHESGPQQMTVKIESITFPSADICLEEGLTTLKRSDESNRYNVVHVKRNGEWKMLSVVESRCDSLPTDSLKDLTWLVGDWTAKTADHAVHLQVNPISNGNFLAAKFTDVDGSTEKPQDLQIIGWDAKTHRIVSWHFGASGGFGFGRWYHDGSNWMSHTHGVTADGADTSADYTYSQNDKDHFSWSSSDRVVSGHRLRDMAPVQVTRSAVESKIPTGVQ